MFRISKIVISSYPQNKSQSTIDLKKINIIVGPNNSGKSTVLKDIHGWFDNKYHQMKVLKRLEICLSNNHNEYNEFEKDILDFQDGQPRKKGGRELIPFVKKHLFEETHSDPVWYNLEDIKYEFNRQNTEYFRQNFFRYFVMRLDGKNRFQLVESKHLHTFRTSRTPHNYLSRLYGNTDDQRKLAKIVNEEFGWYTYLKKDKDDFINIFLSKVLKIEIDGLRREEDTTSGEEIIPLNEFGDGVQCFVGLCLAVLSCPFRIVMIDEPETYLHPPTIYSLGKNLSEWAKEKDRSLIIASHSSDFLMGCLQSAPVSDISIIRLTYENNIGKVNKLEDREVLYYVGDPLLRSTDFLNALFYNSSVVTEGDDDKVVYQEANKKLLGRKRGIDKNMFLGANGKQVVRRIIRPLRKIGIPAAGIYDFDVLKHQKIRKGTLWKAILSSSNVESSKSETLEIERQYIESQLKSLNVSKGCKEDEGYFKMGLSKEMPPEVYTKVCRLLDELKHYGIFIVPVGTLERWLTNIKEGNSDEPFISLLEKIDKTEPSDNDIWQFLNEINNWISNPNRKGMIA